MTHPRSELLYGRDTPALPMCPNTYRPGCGWRDLTIAERDEARRHMGIMAYPMAHEERLMALPERRAVLALVILSAALVTALVLVGIAWRLWHG